MLELSDIQGRILNAFVEYDGDNKGEIGYGLTSGKLGKLGINRKTFDNTDKNSINNKDFLLDNYFLRITRKESHGQQYWIYYKITTLGVIAYLKWASELKSEYQVSYSQTFFPLITRHLKKIIELYGDTVSHILSNTALRINIKSQVSGIIKNQRVDSRTLICSMTLRVGDFDIIYDQFLDKPLFKKIKHIVDIDYEDEINDKLNQKLSDCFTFVFYYNLINSGLNANEIVNLFIKEYNTFEKKNGDYYIDEKKFKIRLKKHQIKLQTNYKKILKLIKSDSELHKLISDNYDEVLSKLDQTSIIEEMRKNL